VAYAGLDNRVAGATAAYLIGQWTRAQPGRVLVTMSDERFRGEEEREISFRQALEARYPHLEIVDASGGHGLDAPTEARVQAALAQHGEIAAVYSMGGGNPAILRAISRQQPKRQKNPICFIGHDLDRDNVRLLRDGQIHAVLHHELRQDLRAACHHVMAFHKLLPASAVSTSSSVVVVTPENIPASVMARLGYSTAYSTES
jgi:LacI family transcriptional regulator